MASPPTIDGAVDDAEWKEAFRSIGFTDPVTGQRAADDSEVWLGYDKRAIYVAFRLTDSQPGRIQARSTQEGSQMDGEDVVAFEIDPLNRRSGETSVFIVNPLGATRENIAGGRSTKKEWRGMWKAKARLTSTGWEAEMMIPWRMLNLPPDRIASMQINFVRGQARTNAKSLWSDTTVRELSEKSGIWAKVEVPTLPIEISLQGYATPEVDEDNDPRFTFRSGLDARVRFTPTINGLASLNPDFKNIEQDVAGIDFTRAERFRGDARPFFQEGAGYFWLTGRHTFGRMFYSNRIDDFDQGVKAFGDIDRKNSFGILAAREDGRRTDVVANFDHKFDFRNVASAYITSRQTPGGRSTAGGVNLNLNNGIWGAGGNLAYNQGQGLDNSRANSVYVEYSVPNFFAIARHMDVQEDFDPALGYVPFRDRHGAYFYSEYSRELRKGPLRFFGADLGIDYFEKGNGSNLFKGASGGVRFTTRSDIFFNLRYNSELFENQLEETGMFSMIFNQSNRERQFGFLVSSGTRGGESTTFSNVFAQARVLKKLVLSLSRDELRYQGSVSQTVLSAGWEMDRFQSVTARGVNRDGKTGWYLAYRKSGNKGLEWYAILGDPNSSEFRKRLAFKVIWAR